MTMDIQSAKLELVRFILELEDVVLIEKIRVLLSTDQSDFWQGLTEAERAEIAIGIKQLDAGMRTSAEDFLKRVS